MQAELGVALSLEGCVPHMASLAPEAAKLLSTHRSNIDELQYTWQISTASCACTSPAVSKLWKVTVNA